MLVLGCDLPDATSRGLRLRSGFWRSSRGWRSPRQDWAALRCPRPIFCGIPQEVPKANPPSTTPRVPLSPAHAELHVGVEEADHRGRGRLPALQPRPDQAFPPVVADDLHQARVPPVHILVQAVLELHCSGHRDASARWPREGPEVTPGRCGQAGALRAPGPYSTASR